MTSDIAGEIKKADVVRAALSDEVAALVSDARGAAVYDTVAIVVRALTATAPGHIVRQRGAYLQMLLDRLIAGGATDELLMARLERLLTLSPTRQEGR